jgi:hypothetical protein
MWCPLKVRAEYRKSVVKVGVNVNVKSAISGRPFTDKRSGLQRRQGVNIGSPARGTLLIATESAI